MIQVMLGLPKQPRKYPQAALELSKRLQNALQVPLEVIKRLQNTLQAALDPSAQSAGTLQAPLDDASRIARTLQARFESTFRTAGKQISARSRLLLSAGSGFPPVPASCRMGRKYECSVWKIKMRPARTDGTHCENEKRYGERILLTQQGCAQARRAGKRFYSTPPRSF